MVDIDEVRKEVSVQLGTVLAKDDPALVTVILTDVVLRRYVEILNAQNLTHREALGKSLNDGITASKAIAGTIITQSAEYVSDQIYNAVDAAMKDGSARNEKIMGRLYAAKKEARSYMIISVVSAAVAVSSMLFGIAEIFV